MGPDMGLFVSKRAFCPFTQTLPWMLTCMPSASVTVVMLNIIVRGAGAASVAPARDTAKTAAAPVVILLMCVLSVIGICPVRYFTLCFRPDASHGGLKGSTLA